MKPELDQVKERIGRKLHTTQMKEVVVSWGGRKEEPKLTKFAESETDAVSLEWSQLDQESRIAKVVALLEKTQFKDSFGVSRATDTGAVYVTMLQPLGPSSRGSILLDLEEFLKEKVDRGINVWCEPIGDRNSLRNLRGVQIIN